MTIGLETVLNATSYRLAAALGIDDQPAFDDPIWPDPAAGWDNRPTWDNVKPGWDNRPTWDNWRRR